MSNSFTSSEPKLKGKLLNIISIFDYYKVNRKAKVTSTRLENDAEHSWSLAALFLYLQVELEQEFGPLDIAKILTLITIHDLGELGTGDIATWDKQITDKVSETEYLKTVLESQMKRPDLSELMLIYESDNPTIEMKIVRSLDRISPVLIRIYSGIGWHDMSQSEHATRQALDNRSLHRHSFSKTMMRLYIQATDYAAKQELFQE
jgi:putative hydrolases of HD superfamily